MPNSDARPSLFEVVIDFHGSIFFWIIAIAATASFPPAIVLVIAALWARYNWLIRRNERQSTTASERNQKEQDRFRSDLEESRVLASRGDADGQFRYGNHLMSGPPYEGIDLIRDEVAGYEWIRKAADQEHPGALRMMGHAHQNGCEPYSVDLERAADFYLRAHHAGQEGMLERIKAIQDSISAHQVDEAIRLRLGLDCESWTQVRDLLETCESPPERLLLEALIVRGELRPAGLRLEGQVSVQAQVEVGHYRLDFLVNDWLAVEVDGRAYHDNPDSFEKDRLRDQRLLEDGITTMRFSARQIFQDAGLAAKKIVEVAESR